MNRKIISRRQFLRGVLACLALPPFESLLRSDAVAAEPGAGRAKSGAPLRLAFVYFPNGAIRDYWRPSGAGSNFQLNRTMQSLARVKHKLQIIGGLEHRAAVASGGGDHATACGTFLTGARVKKTAGADIHAGISIDQIVASRIGGHARFPSIELTCDGVRTSSICDGGYACAYQYNLAWSSPAAPLAPEFNPRFLFERLFGAGSPVQRAESLRQRREQQRSIIDFVLEDARALRPQLGSRDRLKLEEYIASVREIEKRIDRVESVRNVSALPADTPEGIPSDFGEYVQIMFEMMRLAFQTDSTRVATFLLANEASNRAFPEIGVREGHHYLSHHNGDRVKIDKVAGIERWYLEQFSKFIEKLDQTQDADGRSVLHNSMILYGSGIADGSTHSHADLPVILAGGGGGALTPGRFKTFDGAPMSNLLLSLADRMGVGDLERFGDSTGRLQGL